MKSSGTVGEALRPDGTIDVFVRGLDGAPWHLRLDASGNNVVQSYESLGGQVQGAMTGSWSADGMHLDVFGVGADSAIYRDRYQSATGTWNGWSLVPGGGTAG